MSSKNIILTDKKRKAILYEILRKVDRVRRLLEPEDILIALYCRDCDKNIKPSSGKLVCECAEREILR